MYENDEDYLRLRRLYADLKRNVRRSRNSVGVEVGSTSKGKKLGNKSGEGTTCSEAKQAQEETRRVETKFGKYILQ